MRTVLLAGGVGTRLSEETVVRPKPMVEIGDKPILWHIMSIYAHHGFSEFLVALGYKGEFIRDYFLSYYERTNDITVHLATGERSVHTERQPDWRIHLVDTGNDTMTGGRIKRLSSWVKDGTFMATYGDGVGDVDIAALVAYHKSHGKLATVTAVRPPARFGEMILDDGQVARFSEKPQTGEGWINGGFFVFEPEVLDYIAGDDTPLERAPLEALAQDNQLMAFKHPGFWQPMDTLREKQILNELWASGRAPWKDWA